MHHGFVRIGPVFIVNGQFGIGTNLSVRLSDLSTTSRSQCSSLLTVFLTVSPL